MAFTRRSAGGHSPAARRGGSPVPDDPAEAADAAYLAGLRMLAMRELSAVALRQRLLDRGFLPEPVDTAVSRLMTSGAQNETRAVRAVAHSLVTIKRHGRLRAQRELEARGFASDEAAAALAELLSDDRERAILDRVLDAKLRGRTFDPADRAAVRRLYATLLRRGYSAGAIRDALRRRAVNAAPPDDSDPDLP